METLTDLNQAITRCNRCPRLRTHCRAIARKKKRQYQDWDYWGQPVPSFGDPRAALWIVGLAPAAHGANRTGRMFTGDSSGDWLYRALHENGFANQAESYSNQDGLRLMGAWITASAHCAPPDNKPTREELQACFPYLRKEYELLPEKRVILALGGIAYQTLWKLLGEHETLPKPRPTFGHNKWIELENVDLLLSYHPSRQNTNTGRLTRKMWHAVFEGARRRIKGSRRE